ncbi:GPW/gp25 family protein [Draconibacterium sp.]|nr:GPW/gp25 family protein [Draconibacterium sp.]
MNNKTNTSFLGTGWDFPPTFFKENASVKMISDIKDINSSLNILLSTRIRERVMQPKYGCDLEELIFEPITLSMLTMMENLVKDAIVFFEPRIKLLDLELEADENEGKVEIRINYMVRSTNSRLNYVYPFYIKEGTEIKK